MDVDPDDDDPIPLIEFRQAKNSFEARIIAAVLDEAGIPTFVAGGLLNDEFAMSQQALGLHNVTVQVPASRVDDAEKALAEAKRAGERMAQADPEDDGSAES